MVTRSILRPVLRPLPLLLMDDDAGFTPRSLFAAGEQGIWLDPSDFSTLFQDSAGTTPVTAVGQPVGLALDKRLGLALGSEQVVNGTFTGGGTGWTNLDTAPSVTTFTGGVATMVAAPGLALALLRQSLTLPAGTYEVSVRVASISGTPAAALAVGNTSFGDTTYTNFSLDSAGVYTRKVTITGPTLGLAFTASNVAGGTIVIDDVSVKLLPGNHAYQTTSASRPTLQQDSNGLYYLSFDGTDDGMATPSIDFTGTDKMTVWAGVRKNSDAASAVVAELSASFGLNTSSFVVYAPLTAAANYAFSSRGTSAGASAITTNIYASPNTSVLTAIGDISGDISRVRVNGVATTQTVDQGTGTYGNYPLYIGRRGGSSVPFNGRIYQLIVRGAASNAGQIAAGEAWCNSKARAY